ncbi:hypothetical protein [Jiella pacifica]|nr:hypothetical protein [Jiella pacifica]
MAIVSRQANLSRPVFVKATKRTQRQEDSMAERDTTKQRHDQPGESAREKQTEAEKVEHEEEELDEALDETFPASDPVSPSRIDGPNN